MATDVWVTRPGANLQARVRLFCFPYAGGGASIFCAWPDNLPQEIEVCSVQLPGRENRLSEPPFTRLSPLIQALSCALLPYLNKPFAFFGHSMGAVVSFELARLLRRSCALSPVHLFVSGHSAPQIPAPHPPIHDLPEPEFLKELRRYNGTPEKMLAQEELMQLMLPTLRADFAICETYAYTSEPPLDCPISAFGGLQDATVSRDHLEAWCDQTGATFKLHMLSGDHFFLHTAPSSLLRILSQELYGLISTLT